ncbi:tetratricopeptide repeat protein [Rheinheimera fenheensis]|uniref:tetratricopeptide repeat protein n=1 Tax=Rheinheimera fenheensis TaxID=3152295 RepID=UPI00325D336A
MKSFLILLAVAVSFSSYATTVRQQVDKYWQDKQLTDAISYLTPLAKQKPADAEALALLGYTQAKQALQTKDMSLLKPAAKNLSKAVSLDNNNAEFQKWYAKTVCLQIAEAGIFGVSGAIKSCMAELETVLVHTPADTEVIERLAMLHVTLPSVMGGRLERALELTEELKAFNPLQADILLFDILAAQNKPAEFNQLLVQSEALTNRPEPYLTRAKFHLGKQKYDDALADFRLAIQYAAADDEQTKTTRLKALLGFASAAIDSKLQLADGAEFLHQFQQLNTDLHQAEQATLLQSRLQILRGDTAAAKLTLTTLSKQSSFKHIRQQSRELLKDI